MKRLAALLPLLFLLAFPGSGLAQDGPSSTEGTPVATPEAIAEPQATLFVRESGTLGRYFSTPAGLTLYITDNDTVPNESTCTGDCTVAWQPFDSSDALSLPGDVSGVLSQFTREDGTTQLSYNGMPLYTYNVDTGSGSIFGDGIDGVWRLAVPGTQLGSPATPVVPTAVDMGTPRPAGNVPVSMREFYIQSAAVTFEQDVEYTFEVTNLGSAEHQFVIETAGSQGQPLETDEGTTTIVTLAPGESATLNVTFTAAGNYQFASHTNTDYEQGMALNITVM